MISKLYRSFELYYEFWSAKQALSGTFCVTMWCLVGNPSNIFYYIIAKFSKIQYLLWWRWQLNFPSCYITLMYNYCKLWPVPSLNICTSACIWIPEQLLAQLPNLDIIKSQPCLSIIVKSYFLFIPILCHSCACDSWTHLIAMFFFPSCTSELLADGYVLWLHILSPARRWNTLLNYFTQPQTIHFYLLTNCN